MTLSRGFIARPLEVCGKEILYTMYFFDVWCITYHSLISFTNEFSIVIQIRWKVLFTLKQIVVKGIATVFVAWYDTNGPFY